MPAEPISPYHLSLRSAQGDVKEFVRTLDAVRNRLIAIVQEKQGKRGCFACGMPASACEFDHEQPTEKVATVCALLQAAKWKAAESEARKCRLLCSACHRKKTRDAGEQSKGRKRLPQSPDEVVEKKRRLDRERAKIARERGKKRLANAKLSRGKCAECKLVVDEDNLHKFDFDHINVTTKRWNMSSLHRASYGNFYSELSKCRLLCVNCHKAVTKEQRASGVIQAKQARVAVERRLSDKGYSEDSRTVSTVTTLYQ